MSKATERHKEQILPGFRTGYAIFVRLWQLTPTTSANTAHRLTTVLDHSLMDIVQRKKDRFFSSPYGGAILVHSVEEALPAADRLMNVLRKAQIEASIAITHGTFEKVYHVTSWNTAALALNIAARMAFSAETKGLVVVSPLVKGKAVAANDAFKSVWGRDITGEVKGYKFLCHVLEVPHRSVGVPRFAEAPMSFDANVLVVDIERYSQKSPAEQKKAVDSLNRSLELAISATGTEPSSYGQAGDGGYFVFQSAKRDSSPQALLFTRELIAHARSIDVPIRTGISSGPVVYTKYRPAVGGTILTADAISSAALRYGLTVSSDFWTSLPEPFKQDLQAVKLTSKPGVLALTFSSAKAVASRKPSPDQHRDRQPDPSRSIDSKQRRAWEVTERLYHEGIGAVFSSDHDPLFVTELLQRVNSAKRRIVLVGMGLSFLKGNTELTTAIALGLRRSKELRVDIFYGDPRGKGILNRTSEEARESARSNRAYNRSWPREHLESIIKTFQYKLHHSDYSRISVSLTDCLPTICFAQIDDGFLWYPYGTPNIRGKESPWILIDHATEKGVLKKFLEENVRYYETRKQNSLLSRPKRRFQKR